MAALAMGGSTKTKAFLAEAASSAFMSFFMNTLGVEAAATRRFLPAAMTAGVDAQTLTLTLLFLHLCFFFSPFYVKKSAGAVNNPTVYVLFWLIGDVAFGAMAIGVAATVVGQTAGLFAYASAMRAFPLPGHAAITRGVTAAGGAFNGALSEGVVAFANFLFAAVALPLAPTALAPALGAAFYCACLVYERCAYSCGCVPSVHLFSSFTWRVSIGSFPRRVRHSLTNPPSPRVLPLAGL